MDWKTIGNYVLLLGLFVAMVSMFNQVNGRLVTHQAETNRRFDEMNRRFDAMQAEMNRRFDVMQTEMNRRFEAMQTEMNRRFDAFQTENQRQHDTMQEVLRVFEGRVTRLEEKTGINPENAELPGRCFRPVGRGLHLLAPPLQGGRHGSTALPG